MIAACRTPFVRQWTMTREGLLVKDFVISVNNVVLYVALAVIWISGLFMFGQSFMAGLGTLVIGTLTWCIISGFWFVQSATYEELRKLNSKP